MSIELKQAAQQAIEAIQDLRGYRPDIDKAIEALRTAIQQAGARTDVRCEGCGYMTHHREHMGCVRAAKQFTHPAPGVPEDVVRNAQRYRWLRRKACVIGKTTYCGEETGQPILDFVNLPDVTEVIRRDSATTLDAAIDAAMTAAQAQKGQP